jgi:hypothetical protein
MFWSIMVCAEAALSTKTSAKLDKSDVLHTFMAENVCSEEFLRAHIILDVTPKCGATVKEKAEDRSRATDGDTKRHAGTRCGFWGPT